MKTDALVFSAEEKTTVRRLWSELRVLIDSLGDDDEQRLLRCLVEALQQHRLRRDVFELNPVVAALQTAVLAVKEENLGRDGVLAILFESLHPTSLQGEAAQGVERIRQGLQRIRSLYEKNPVVESENFRNLLLSFAEDMRVILIMIADRVNLMRNIRDTKETEARAQVAEEAARLYAPLAHKLGLYKLKSELEDLSLKYLEHDAYYMIRKKLSATKAARDAYIARFVKPIEARLRQEGIDFHMKGRTKSIHSIWQKMKKQQCDFEGVFDLFAIRIIVNCPEEREKEVCWRVFAYVTEMYASNPKRVRDWLSVPKSNGYESLHATVLGPEEKWVEVQIRSERMDEVAERGVAAHWRYKGVKAEGGLDGWLAGIRRMLENATGAEAMDDFKMDLYDKEIYAFTPHGDLFKLAKGATVLDFAYHIHSNVGNTCIGARINGRIVPIREELHSGDTVEIITQNNQKPKLDWMNIVKTSRARSKLRLALKETQAKDAQLVKETLERKFKNKKIELKESLLAQTIKKLGFKVASDFYKQLAEEHIDMNTVIEKYLEVRDREAPHPTTTRAGQQRSAQEFVYDDTNIQAESAADDVLIIDKNVKGIDYSLAKCCHPIYGDQVFGFVTSGGGIKVHRVDCPNAPELKRRFGYRIVKAQWSGKGSSQYSITLRVIGNDDIGIVNNITSIISKEEKIVMRSINIDSRDGLFSGNIEVMLEDTSRLAALIKKLTTVKGVKQVERI